jgi:hypothetical protein
MMPAIGSWNIRGGHHVIKLDQCKKLISDHKLCILAILETKLNHELTLKATNYINPTWKLLHNLAEVTHGRIMILFNPDHVILSSILSTPQMLHCHAISFYDHSSFYLTFVYGHNSTTFRLSLHNDIPFLR